MEVGVVKVVVLIDEMLVVCVGLKFGDLIIYFDGEVILGFILGEVVEKMCGFVKSVIELIIVW